MNENEEAKKEILPQGQQEGQQVSSPDNSKPEGPKPLDRGQMETNIRVAKQWMNALRMGTFPGAVVPDISGLIAFLEQQHDMALAEYEKEALKHPEWGGPRPCDRCKQVPGKQFVADTVKGTKEWVCTTCLQRQLNEEAKASVAASQPVGMVQ